MDETFLGLDQLSLAWTNRQRVCQLLEKYPQSLTGYTWACLWAWKSLFHYAFCFFDEQTLLISCSLENQQERHLLQPLGEPSERFHEHLLNTASKLSYPLKIYGVSEKFIEENHYLVKHFKVQENRAGANYLYSASDLALLPGNKYSDKRNLLAQAQRAYNWKVLHMDHEKVAACQSILQDIAKTEKHPPSSMQKHELVALKTVLADFAQLSQQGILIEIDDQPAAFSIFEQINPQTIVVHFERAFRRYKGLYQLINRETARVALEQGYNFINREEDLGQPGLRQSKLSYNPISLIKSYLLTIYSR